MTGAIIFICGVIVGAASIAFAIVVYWDETSQAAQNRRQREKSDE